MTAINNAFKLLQKEVGKWHDLRKQTANSSQELLNLINRSSYMTNNKAHNAFGDAVMPSRLSSTLVDEISEKSARLHSIQNEMLECLKQIATLQSSVFPAQSANSSESVEGCIISSLSQTSSTHPIEGDAFSLILHQMQQQTLLEMCIVEKLCGPEEPDEYDDDDEYDDEDDNDLNNEAEKDENIDPSSEGIENLSIGNTGKFNLENRKQSFQERNKSLKGTPSAEMGGMSDDQDASVTMLACFSYPPFLRVSELESFMELK